MKHLSLQSFKMFLLCNVKLSLSSQDGTKNKLYYILLFLHSHLDTYTFKSINDLEH